MVLRQMLVWSLYLYWGRFSLELSSMIGFPGCGAGMFLIHRASKTRKGTCFQTTDLLCLRMGICVQLTSSSLPRVLRRLSQFLIGNRQAGIRTSGKTVKQGSQHRIVESGVALLISYWILTWTNWRHSISTCTHSVDFQHIIFERMVCLC